MEIPDAVGEGRKAVKDITDRRIKTGRNDEMESNKNIKKGKPLRII